MLNLNNNTGNLLSKEKSISYNFNNNKITINKKGNSINKLYDDRKYNSNSLTDRKIQSKLENYKLYSGNNVLIKKTENKSLNSPNIEKKQLNNNNDSFKKTFNNITEKVIFNITNASNLKNTIYSSNNKNTKKSKPKSNLDNFRTNNGNLKIVYDKNTLLKYNPTGII